MTSRFITSPNSRRRNRTAFAGALLAVAALSLAACDDVDFRSGEGNDDFRSSSASSSSSPSSSSPYAEDWESSDPMLREDDLNFTYEQASTFEDEDLTRAGCLAAIDTLTQNVERQMAVMFTTDNPFDSPFVKHQVLEFASDGSAENALKEWESAAAACESIEYYENDSRLTLDVATDNDKYSGSVDAEVNLLATGGVDTDNFGMDVNQWISAARVGRHLSIIQVLDLDDDDAADEGRRLTELTANRLDAWAGDTDN